MKQILLILLIVYLSSCTGDIIARKKRRNKHIDVHNHAHNHKHNKKENNDVSSSHVVVSKEGPPPSPQEYTISKLEEAVVCDARGDKTWAKWKDYDLDKVCSRLQYYGEIEGQCETDCDVLCPQGFYEVAKEECVGQQHIANDITQHLTDVATGMGDDVHIDGDSGGDGGVTHVHHIIHHVGYYRQCVGRYKCTQTSYDYWVNMKWWQFLLWELLIVILGCCFFGLAVGCCIRCYYQRNSRRRNTGASNRRQPADQNRGNQQRNNNNNNNNNNNQQRNQNYNNNQNNQQ